MLIDWGLLCTNQTGNVIMQFNAILHELTLFDLLVFFSRVVDAAVGRIFKICGQVYWKHVTFHNTFEPLIFFLSHFFCTLNHDDTVRRASS